MENRDFIINLSILGFENYQMLALEKILEENEIEKEALFDKEEIKKYEDILTKQIYKRLLRYQNDLLDRLNSYCYKEGIKIHTIYDKTYPEDLLYIENSPKILYSKGNLRNKASYPVAIVGARKHTNYSKIVVDSLVDYLKDYDTSIISGMAYGVDSLSHQAALRNNLQTIAVLGSGIDQAYPKTNARLYESILENDGMIISEYGPGVLPLPYRFPLRNRIISGLSKILIVTEAKEKSGSLITARLAAEQGKEVFAVPGNINSQYSSGTNKLILDGANILTSVKDLETYLPNKKSDSYENSYELSGDEKTILENIESGLDNINLLSAKLNIDISKLNSIITMLEMKNLIIVDGENIESNI